MSHVAVERGDKPLRTAPLVSFQDVTPGRSDIGHTKKGVQSSGFLDLKSLIVLSQTAKENVRSIESFIARISANAGCEYTRCQRRDCAASCS